jgi:TetR/AcrR family acrAB operon transcriptional repressor
VKRKLQGLATREKLLDSAEMLFFERGVAPITLEHIARASGMTRGAIYGHFTNKWSLVNALFERSALPLDPFTVSPGATTASTMLALRDELEWRLIDVLQAGAKRRLYSIALSTAEIEGDCLPSGSLLRESALFAQASIEATLMLVAKAQGVSAHLDYALEASFIHACLTGYFRHSLHVPPPSGAEKLLAAKILRKAFSTLIAD